MSQITYNKKSKYLLIAAGFLLAVLMLLNSFEVYLPKPIFYILIGVFTLFIIVGVAFLIKYFPHEMKRQEEELERRKEERRALAEELREKHKNVDWSKEPDYLNTNQPSDDDGFIPMGDIFS